MSVSFSSESPLNLTFELEIFSEFSRVNDDAKKDNCYFSKFWDIPTVFCNHPKILPQSNTIKRCRQKCKHL